MSPALDGAGPPQSPWRLLDTGVRPAAENIALDQALLSERCRGSAPNTLRFLQFSPACALVGFHQRVDQEVRLDYCRQRGLEVNRRLTGGGALLFDEPQLGWELIADRGSLGFNPFASEAQERLCQGALEGLKRLGVAAQFRPRNDLEVGGRKLSGTGGVGEGDAVLFQGTLLIDFDLPAMLRALRVPVEKLKQSELDSAADRVTWLDRELGRKPPLAEIKAALVEGFSSALGVAFQPGGLTAEEQAAAEQLLPKFSNDEWIFGRRQPRSQVEFFRGYHRTPGASFVVEARVDLQRRRLCDCLFSGDFFLHPQRVLFDIESALREVRLEWEEVAKRVYAVWEGARPETSGFGPDDLLTALRGALERVELIDRGFTVAEAGALFPVCGSPNDILDAPPSLLLLPYCSKLPECDYRRRPDCPRCGDCTVGEAHLQADAAGMESLTVTSFEHLLDELQAAKARGVRAFVGCCCEAFVRKHCDDFARAELPGLLVDLCDATCYDLDQRHEAYRGTFESLTRLDLDLLNKVLNACAT